MVNLLLYLALEVADMGVPVAIAAKVFKKDPAWVRAGIICGWLPIGTATRNGQQITDLTQMDSKKGRINYYISPKLLYDLTGYEWRNENGSFEPGRKGNTGSEKNSAGQSIGYSQGRISRNNLNSIVFFLRNKRSEEFDSFQFLRFLFF